MRGLCASHVRWVLFGCLFASVLLASGCGDKGRVMTKVSGKVTFDGEPIDDGQILFRRTSGEKKGYEAPIKKGAYEIECEPGDVKVEITAYRIVPGKFTTVNGPKEPVREMYIPEKFNAKSTLERQLSGSDSTLSFELTSK